MRLEHLLSGENDCREVKKVSFNPCFFTADVYNIRIEKDEAERSNGEA